MRVLLLLALAWAAGAECPSHCECKWRNGKESAICTRAGLTAVPARLDPTTQLLDLSENRMSTLQNNAFANANLLNLQRLYLSDCNVKTIRQHAFRDLINLIELDLSGNRLETIPSHAFGSISELRELKLAGNSITRVKDDAFTSVPHLVRLSLSENKISEIEPRAFVGLEGSLEYLELDKNRLQVLHVAVLVPLRSLKGLELASNPWECTCALRPMRDWMIKRNVPATVVPDCAMPPRLISQSWDRLDLEDFACPPEVSATSNSFKSVEGDEVTLVCRVNGVPAPRVRWVRAGRLLANSSSSNINSGRSFILRSEGKTSNLTIKAADMQDTGLYTCNAENRAGKAEAVLSLTIERKPQDKGFGGRALMAAMAVSAVIVLISCIIIGLCAYETRKKRLLDRWNEQIVATYRRDDNYEKIEVNMKGTVEAPRVLSADSGRKRGDYRNVPSQDPEDDCGGYLREEVREEGDSMTLAYEAGWRRAELNKPSGENGMIERDLHIPRLKDYNKRIDGTPESLSSSTSMGVLSAHAEHPSSNRFNNNARKRPQGRRQERLDNDLSGSDSEKIYPDVIEMSTLGTSSYLRSEMKHDPYFYTIPRSKDGESRSPLLNSRRNSSGGDSETIFDRGYDRKQPRNVGRRSNSFLDLSSSGRRLRSNPSLPSSPAREQPTAPSATPLLDLSGLRDYTRMDQPIDDFDFRAAQLEKILEEYRTVSEQLSRMKETRENFQRNRPVDHEELRSNFKGKPSVAVTEMSSSALADAASPLAMSSSEYKPPQPRPEWLTSLLYRD